MITAKEAREQMYNNIEESYIIKDIMNNIVEAIKRKEKYYIYNTIYFEKPKSFYLKNHLSHCSNFFTNPEWEFLKDKGFKLNYFIISNKDNDELIDGIKEYISW